MAAVSGDYEYTVAANGVTITKYTGSGVNISIPASIEDAPVRVIATAAFRDLSALKTVVIPQSVIGIEDNAFYNCRSLSEAYFLHTDGRRIGFSGLAFNRVASDFTIIYPYDAAGYTAPYWNEYPARADRADAYWDYKLVDGDVMLTLYKGSSASVVIPSAIDGKPVRHITNNTFQDNAEIREVVIPETVTNIYPLAFYNCPGLQAAYFKHTDGTKVFARSAFSGVHPNFSIIYPAAATGFTTPIWEGYPAGPDVVSDIWEYSINAGAVTITQYKGGAAQVAVPDALEGMPVRAIASAAFFNNPALVQVSIPASVTTVESRAFFGCHNLIAAYLRHKNAATLAAGFATDAFIGTAQTFRLIYPSDAAGFTSPGWKGYPAESERGGFYLRSGDFEYTITRTAVTGTEIAREEATITRYVGSAEAVTVPSSIDGVPVTRLGDYAFFNNRALVHVTLPETLTAICESAQGYTFAGCTGLTSIVIPASVASIGSKAFSGCTGLFLAYLYQTDASRLRIYPDTFVNTAPGFQIVYPKNGAGYTTPLWNGYAAYPEGHPQALQPGSPPPSATATPNPSQSGQTTLKNPLIATKKTFDTKSDHISTNIFNAQGEPRRYAAPVFASINNATYVNAAVIGDILGLETHYDAATQVVTFTGYNMSNQYVTMSLALNNTTMRVNGVQRSLGSLSGALPRNNEVFVAFGVFIEVFGITLRWDGATTSVVMNA
jgi:hypothetical protein